MKQIAYIFIIILSSLFIISCSEDKEDNPPTPTTFSAKVVTDEPVSSEGGEVGIDIQGGNLGWFISSTSDWNRFSKTTGQAGSTTLFGSGNARIFVVIGQNTTGNSRHSTVTIQPTFGVLPVDIEIKQN